MTKIIKNIRLENELIEKLSEIANECHGGNFTAAVESLLNQSIQVRGLPIKTRWNMYDHVKNSEYERTEKETGSPNIRQLIDALHI